MAAATLSQPNISIRIVVVRLICASFSPHSGNALNTMDSLAAQVLRAVDRRQWRRIGSFYRGCETLACGYTQAGAHLMIVGPSPARMPGRPEQESH
jgi:hypothetical protein